MKKVDIKWFHYLFVLLFILLYGWLCQLDNPTPVEYNESYRLR